MSAAHTPGPWEWTPLDYAPEVFQLENPEGKKVIDDGSAWGEYGPSIDVSGPDARLIAAAPELLEALQMLVAPNGFHHTLHVADIVAIARAVINKATGSAS